MSTEKIQKRNRRHARVRKAIASKNMRPRLCVHRSNRYMTGQVIDDVTAQTMAAVNSKSIAGATFTERAFASGVAIAKLATKAGVTQVIFDRGGYLYTGRVKAFAEGAREGGLEF